MYRSFSHWTNDLFFSQPFALERVALLRVLTVFIALLMLAFGPYDTSYHIDAAEIMYRAKPPFPSIPTLGENFAILKTATIAVGILALAGFYTRWTLVLFTMGYCFLNFIIYAYQNHYCMNQAHLNLILVTLTFAKTDQILAIDKLRQLSKPSKKEIIYASWVLTFTGAFIATLLFQTGLSKLIYGGWGWFTSGDTLYVETILDGTSFGRKLTTVRIIFPIMGIALAFFELGMPWLFLWRKYHTFLGATLLLFHLGTFAIMGISFWFLWPLYFPTLLMAKQVPSFMIVNDRV